MVLQLLPPELQEMVVSLLPISSRAGEHLLKSSYSDPFFCLNLNSPQSSLGGVPPLAPLPLHADPLLNHLHNQPAERPARLGAKRSRQPALVLRCARPERDLAWVAHLLRGTSLQGQECAAGGFHYWQWQWQNKIWYWCDHMIDHIWIFKCENNSDCGGKGMDWLGRWKCHFFITSHP